MPLPTNEVLYAHNPPLSEHPSPYKDADVPLQLQHQVVEAFPLLEQSWNAATAGARVCWAKARREANVLEKKKHTPSFHSKLLNICSFHEPQMHVIWQTVELKAGNLIHTYIIYIGGQRCIHTATQVKPVNLPSPCCVIKPGSLVTSRECAFSSFSNPTVANVEKRRMLGDWRSNEEWPAYLGGTELPDSLASTKGFRENIRLPIAALAKSTTWSTTMATHWHISAVMKDGSHFSMAYRWECCRKVVCYYYCDSSSWKNKKRLCENSDTRTRTTTNL